MGSTVVFTDFPRVLTFFDHYPSFYITVWVNAPVLVELVQYGLVLETLFISFDGGLIKSLG